MEPRRNNTREAVGKIRQALRARKDSIPAWAERHGYAVRTVYQAIDTWAGRTDRAPLGGVSRSIMADLRKDLGADLVPHPSARKTAA